LNIKLTPKIIYPALVIILAAILIILVTKKSDKGEPNMGNMPMDSIHQKYAQMPRDSIHGMGNGAPSKMNLKPEALEEMRRVEQEAKDNPNDTAKLRAYAEYLAPHKPAEAMGYFQKILTKNPKRIDIMMSMSQLEYMQGNAAKSKEYLNKVLTIDKNYVPAYYNLGVIAADKQNYSEARGYWEKIVNQYPGSELAGVAKASLKELSEIEKMK
jgi:tetratricopeptide (TPR) repeat protein